MKKKKGGKLKRGNKIIGYYTNVSEDETGIILEYTITDKKVLKQMRKAMTANERVVER